MSRILGIETSCDETGLAVVLDGRSVLANEVASQVSVHAAYGGVVPEIASRRHTECIFQLAARVLANAQGPVDAVAATQGPGLLGSLLVGMCFGKSLAYTWGVPFLPVHHLEGHIFSVFLGDHPPELPFLALIVSGGHTCLVACDAPHVYRLLGTTRDDAVGECFDKVARLLDLPYPGGPSIQRAAQDGDPHAIHFPRGMLKDNSLDFSYSGLKTAVLYELRRHKPPVADVAASFQYAAVDALVAKTQTAVRSTGLQTVVLAGGVAANRLLRERLQNELDVNVTMPPFEYCLDNGAMIAAAGDSRLRHGLIGDFAASARANLPLC
jgi:N6-L-threonylcarbamoyladenine synthase